MKRDNDRQASIVLAVIGIPLVIWLALLIAPSQHRRTTEGVRNTVLRNGAAQKPWIRNTDNPRPRKIN